ncbi:GMC oxidoreductase [Amphritea sp. HPY]|uniref:GMC oxidoreductase n=1 Tax=Amphritea sp. HPY TaxID=3421652 RepID=UPI003D7C7CE1
MPESKGFFTEEELQTITRFIDLLIPSEPDSPGAVFLGIPSFIDTITAKSPQDNQQSWRNGIRHLNDYAISTTGQSFSSASLSQATRIMGELLDANHTGNKAATFSLMAKSTAINSYYRTEHGLHQELRVAKHPNMHPPVSSSLNVGPPEDFYDVIVVGSGATGGWAALALTRAGFKVLVVDAGSDLRPKNDFREHDFPYDLPYRNMLSNTSMYAKTQKVQSKVWACNEYAHHMFDRDDLNPYQTQEDQPYVWVRGSKLGGRTNMWGRQVYRYSDHDFKAASTDGFGVDWPISYADLEPYYDEVESYIGVSANRDGIPTLPDGPFLPSMYFTEGERHLKSRVETKWPERRVIIGRTATLTQSVNSRTPCHYCGHCYRGCGSFSFFSSVGSTLKEANSTGNLRITTDAHVSHVLMTSDNSQARGVEYVNKQTGETVRVEAKAVVLAASTLATTRILLSSRTSKLPNGIGAKSGALGHYLHGHVHSVWAVGWLPEVVRPPGIHDEGRPNGIYIPQFKNIPGKDPETKFIRGYGIEGAVKHYMIPRDIKKRPGFGTVLKESIRTDNIPARFYLTAFGPMLPRSENKVELTKKKDAWGLPTLKIKCTYGPNDKMMIEDMVQTLQEMTSEAGLSVTSIRKEAGTPGLCVHEVGSARMGTSPKNSVVAPDNTCWDAPNLLVVDGACFPSSGPQNPTLTMMAISLRAATLLAGRLKAP